MKSFYVFDNEIFCEKCAQRYIRQCVTAKEFETNKVIDKIKQSMRETRRELAKIGHDGIFKAGLDVLESGLGFIFDETVNKFAMSTDQEELPQLITDNNRKFKCERCGVCSEL